MDRSALLGSATWDCWWLNMRCKKTAVSSEESSGERVRSTTPGTIGRRNVRWKISFVSSESSFVSSESSAGSVPRTSPSTTLGSWLVTTVGTSVEEMGATGTTIEDDTVGTTPQEEDDTIGTVASECCWLGRNNDGSWLGTIDDSTGSIGTVASECCWMGTTPDDDDATIGTVASESSSAGDSIPIHIRCAQLRSASESSESSSDMVNDRTVLLVL